MLYAKIGTRQTHSAVTKCSCGQYFNSRPHPGVVRVIMDPGFAVPFLFFIDIVTVKLWRYNLKVISRSPSGDLDVVFLSHCLFNL